eukprot:8828952-Lingulodinium_polyedra.AAC.1
MLRTDRGSQRTAVRSMLRTPRFAACCEHRGSQHAANAAVRGMLRTPPFAAKRGSQHAANRGSQHVRTA